MKMCLLADARLPLLIAMLARPLVANLPSRPNTLQDVAYSGNSVDITNQLDSFLHRCLYLTERYRRLIVLVMGWPSSRC